MWEPSTDGGCSLKTGWLGSKCLGPKSWEESGVALYDYGFRIYNPGIARFLSVDPLAPDYPWYTPYQFAGNMPIWAIDIDGLEPGVTSGSNEAEAPVDGGDLETVVVTAKRAADNDRNGFHDYSADRYGTNEYWPQYQQRLGLENWSYHDYSNHYSENYAPTWDAQVREWDRQERARIAVERLLNFALWYEMIGTVVAPAGGGGPINGANFRAPQARGLNLSAARGRKIHAQNNSTVLGKDGATLRNMGRMVPEPGSHQLLVHGHYDNFIIDGVVVSPKTVARNLLANGVSPGTPIRCISCHTGAYPDGAAYQLSRYMRSPVLAPNNKVRILDDGTFEIFGNGHWIQF